VPVVDCGSGAINVAGIAEDRTHPKREQALTRLDDATGPVRRDDAGIASQ